jgi:hypothetical protein
VTDYNAPGQHHTTVYCAPENDETPLYYPDGTRTGQSLWRSQLNPDGVAGKIRLDHHEVISAQDGRRYVFARGGLGYRPPVPYGHVWVGDLAESPGIPVPSGGRRGAAAPSAHRVVQLTVQPIPLEMGYKVDPGSRWATYGDAGAKYAYPGQYSYLLWSLPNVAGGGMVRALLPNAHNLGLCDVPRIHCKSYASDGTVNGEVIGAYVGKSGLYGWTVVAHRYQDGELVSHIA